MRSLPFLLAGLCLLATPGVAAQTPGTPDVWLEDHESDLDELLDATVLLDAHLGDTGSCVRQNAVEETKDIYGHDDLQHETEPGKNEIVECVAAQCIGWPPQPFVSLRSCRTMVEETVKDLIGIEAELSDT